MKEQIHIKDPVRLTSFLIIILAGICTAVGIWSSGKIDLATIETVRGTTVRLYGTGLYAHMSEDVAIQGIAQDYISLFFALPALLVTILRSHVSTRARLVQTGILGYLLVTYLFYLVMAMYNELFLLYVLLLTTTFYAFITSLTALLRDYEAKRFSLSSSLRTQGIFLIINASAIALLWLSVILPPLFDRSIYPPSLEHYTTLIVQGLDLGLLLPLCLYCGVMAIRKNGGAQIGAIVYLVFLVFLMSALTAKLVAMGLNDVPILPAIVIIPTILLVDLVMAVRALRSV